MVTRMNSNHQTGESKVPFGEHSINRVRHIRLGEQQKEVPVYFQDPNAPVFHPSRDPTARAKMLDNLQ